ncbi:MAG: AEC family transporter [Clostridiales bacterium]
MENLLFSINSIAPIFLVMGLGYLLKNKGLLNNNFIDTGTKIVFNICIPCMLYRDITANNVGAAFDFKLLAAAVCGTLFVYGLLCLLIPRILKDPPTYTAFIQGSFRSNFIVIGLPIVSNVAGAIGVTKVALALCVIAPLYNILSVLILSRATANQSGKMIWRNILTNPLIIGTFLGLSASLLQFQLPLLFSAPIDSLAAMAMPLALLTLGGSISFTKGDGDIQLAAIAALFKTIVNPLLMLPIFYCIQLSRLDMVVLLILFSCPTAIASFPMAYQMKANHHLASMIIVFSNVLSVFSLFFFIYIMRLLSWI